MARRWGLGGPLVAALVLGGVLAGPAHARSKAGVRDTVREAWRLFGPDAVADQWVMPTLRAAVGTLRPGGVLALALHVGQSVLHTEEFLGATVDLDFVLHDRDQVLAAMQGAGLVVDEWYERSPVGSEADTVRLYVLAHRE